MNADSILAAFATEKGFRLVLEKRVHPGIPDFFQILDQAHPIRCSVTSVDILQSFAGKIGTFIAKRYAALRNQLALSFEVSTLFIAGPTARTMRNLPLFFLDAVRKC